MPQFFLLCFILSVICTKKRPTDQSDDQILIKKSKQEPVFIQPYLPNNSIFSDKSQNNKSNEFAYMSNYKHPQCDNETIETSKDKDSPYTFNTNEFLSEDYFIDTDSTKSNESDEIFPIEQLFTFTNQLLVNREKQIIKNNVTYEKCIPYNEIEHTDISFLCYSPKKKISLFQTDYFEFENYFTFILRIDQKPQPKNPKSLLKYNFIAYPPQPKAQIAKDRSDMTKFYKAKSLSIHRSFTTIMNFKNRVYLFERYKLNLFTITNQIESFLLIRLLLIVNHFLTEKFKNLVGIYEDKKQSNDFLKFYNIVIMNISLHKYFLENKTFRDSENLEPIPIFDLEGGIVSNQTLTETQINLNQDKSIETLQLSSGTSQETLYKSELEEISILNTKISNHILEFNNFYFKYINETKNIINNSFSKYSKLVTSLFFCKCIYKLKYNFKQWVYSIFNNDTNLILLIIFPEIRYFFEFINNRDISFSYKRIHCIFSVIIFKYSFYLSHLKEIMKNKKISSVTESNLFNIFVFDMRMMLLVLGISLFDSLKIIKILFLKSFVSFLRLKEKSILEYCLLNEYNDFIIHFSDEIILNKDPIGVLLSITQLEDKNMSLEIIGITKVLFDIRYKRMNESEKLSIIRSFPQKVIVSDKLFYNKNAKIVDSITLCFKELFNL